MDGYMDRWMDGWLAGWMDGWMDRCMCVCSTQLYGDVYWQVPIGNFTFLFYSAFWLTGAALGPMGGSKYCAPFPALFATSCYHGILTRSSQNWRKKFQESLMPFSNPCAAWRMMEISGFQWFEVRFHESFREDNAFVIVSRFKFRLS